MIRLTPEAIAFLNDKDNRRAKIKVQAALGVTWNTLNGWLDINDPRLTMYESLCEIVEASRLPVSKVITCGTVLDLMKI